MLESSTDRKTSSVRPSILSIFFVIAFGLVLLGVAGYILTKRNANPWQVQNNLQSEAQEAIAPTLPPVETMADFEAKLNNSETTPASTQATSAARQGSAQ